MTFLAIYVLGILGQWYISASVPLENIEYVRFSLLWSREQSEAVREKYFSHEKIARMRHYYPHPVFLEKGWREKWMNIMGSSRGFLVWSVFVFPASFWFATRYAYIFG